MRTNTSYDISQYLGLHVGGDEKALLGIPSLYAKGFRVFQVFLSPADLIQRVDRERVVGFSASLPSDITLVAHAPYFMNLCTTGDLKHWQASLRYLVRAGQIASQIGVSRLVTHIGAISGSQSITTGYYALFNFCSQWLELTEGLDVILCLENDAGSNTGKKIGSLKLLYKVIKEMKHPRIRMCFDTEHAYANGFDLSQEDILQKVLAISSVVHLNAIPSYVERGSHIDRHSETLIQDSKEGPDPILKIARGSLERELPMILERRELWFLFQDYAFVSETLSQGVI